MTDDKLGEEQRQPPRKRGLPQEVEGEARDDLRSGESKPVNDGKAHPPWKELMEEVVAPTNIARAMKRVATNKRKPRDRWDDR